MTNYIVYKLTNLITEEIYIGQTQNFNRRMRVYSQKNCKAQKKLFNSITKYGWSNFKSEILYKTNINFIDNLETFYISFYNSCYFNNTKGLNMTTTGKASFRGYKHTEDFKQKAKIRMKGLYSGRKHSEETKLKMSKNSRQLGKFNLEHHKSIQIYQYDLEGNFINTYPSIREAGRVLNVNSDLIQNAIPRKGTSCGYYWSKEKLEKFPIKFKKKKKH